MKAWKKRWQQELDNQIPDLREDVKSAPIALAEERERFKTFSAWKVWFVAHKKRFFASVSACLAAVIAFCVSLPVLFPKNEPKDYSGAYFLEINPSAVFSVNQDGKISAVVAANSDADVILSEETRKQEIVGKSVEEGIQVFVDYAARLGYLDLNGRDAVRVSSYGEGVLLGKIEAEVKGYFLEKGAYSVVVKQTLSDVEFCGRLGITQTGELQTLLQTLDELPTLYVKRQAESATTQDELKILYEEFVSFEELENLIALMELLGMDTEPLKALLELPQTLEEYTQKLDGYLKQSYESLIKDYKSAYETSREAISESDYESYLQDLVTQYGSLENYWNSLK